MKQHCRNLNKRVTHTVHTRYLLHLPAGYENQKRKRWPLVLFLHGAGERGADLELVKTHGPPKLVAAGQQFPFILVSPQCRDDEWWDVETLTALLDTLARQYRVDPKRIYVTGLSMGGYGAWALALAYPDRFAAIVPICGGGRTLLAKKIARLPIWAFHGAQDDTVPLEQSKRMIAALRRAGNKQARLTIYPDAGHDSWTETYANPALYRWLLKQQRR